MRVIPPEISLVTKSSAEKRLHGLLKQVGLEGWVALHSIGLSWHEYKTVGEIDFLMVTPKGLLALEVKGGGIRFEDGIWIYRDRWGKDHRNNEGPFKQAESGLFALLKRLKKILPEGTLQGVPFSWGVVFPDISFTQTAPDWAPAQVIDTIDMESPTALRVALQKLVKHAQERRTDRRMRARELSKNHLKLIVEAVRPDFEQLPSLRRRTDDLSEQTLALTEAQYRYLDASEAASRLICDGGAGTGKTFLAAEAARREAAGGHTVTVVCRSSVLAAFISGQVGMNHESITVTPISRLDQAPSCQSLIVDEGQDLMNLEDLTALDGHLTGGLENGLWRIFLDQNHQADVLGVFEPDALELIEGYSDSLIHLPENCRNTKNIVAEVERIIGVDMGRPLTGNGPVPLWRWWTEPSKAADELSGYLSELIDDQGIAPHEITILTGGAAQDDPVISALPKPLRSTVEPLSENSINRRPPGKIGAVRIGLFKGLESAYVCITDIPSLDASLEPEGVAELYVAMTRACAGLWLGLPARLTGPIQSLGGRSAETGSDR